MKTDVLLLSDSAFTADRFQSSGICITVYRVRYSLYSTILKHENLFRIETEKPTGVEMKAFLHRGGRPDVPAQLRLD